MYYGHLCRAALSLAILYKKKAGSVLLNMFLKPNWFSWVALTQAWLCAITCPKEIVKKGPNFIVVSYNRIILLKG